MKIREFLHNCEKERLPFILYSGNGKGYKICCLECNFFEPDENGIWQCDSVFLSCCREEFKDWVERTEMPNEY